MATVIVNRRIRPERSISWTQAPETIESLDELARRARVELERGRTVALRDLLSQVDEARGKATQKASGTGLV